jgi:hypothetical protein
LIQVVARKEFSRPASNGCITAAATGISGLWGTFIYEEMEPATTPKPMGFSEDPIKRTNIWEARRVATRCAQAQDVPFM